MSQQFMVGLVQAVLPMAHSIADATSASAAERVDMEQRLAAVADSDT